MTPFMPNRQGKGGIPPGLTFSFSSIPCSARSNFLPTHSTFLTLGQLSFLLAGYISITCSPFGRQTIMVLAPHSNGVFRTFADYSDVLHGGCSRTLCSALASSCRTFSNTSVDSAGCSTKLEAPSIMILSHLLEDHIVEHLQVSELSFSFCSFRGLGMGLALTST